MITDCTFLPPFCLSRSEAESAGEWAACLKPWAGAQSGLGCGVVSMSSITNRESGRWSLFPVTPLNKIPGTHGHSDLI